VPEEERESVQAILQPHVTFHINPSMLRMDEIVGQTPLKDLSQIQLVLTRIPLGALHRLQVSINHKLQSHARRDLTELKQATKKRDTLEIVYEKAKSETEEEREHIKGLEQKVAGTYEKIPQAVQSEEITAAEKIDRIAQAIDQYQKEIENLREHLIPTTPPTVKEKRKQEATTQLQEIEQQVSTTTDLFDKATQLWTSLEEDQQIQKWDKEEERINAVIQELKQRQKTMPVTERVKGTQEMKKLQAELTTTQTQKHERQTQMEPLQERVAEVLAQAEEAKTQIAQTQAECRELVSDEVTAQVVDTIKEKTVQAQTQATELKEKFQTITKEIEEAQKD
jgi:DNA repair exonuclease SbcCD ATPase subunit